MASTVLRRAARLLQQQPKRVIAGQPTAETHPEVGEGGKARYQCCGVGEEALRQVGYAAADLAAVGEEWARHAGRQCAYLCGSMVCTG